jgi:hypothetical protein
MQQRDVRMCHDRGGLLGRGGLLLGDVFWWKVRVRPRSRCLHERKRLLFGELRERSLPLRSHRGRVRDQRHLLLRDVQRGDVWLRQRPDIPPPVAGELAITTPDRI